MSPSSQVPSTLHALQTSTRQHSLGFSHYSSAEYNKISSGMMLQSMIFSAWLIQVFLASSYHSTPVQILQCLCLALPPCGVLYLQTVDPTSPWKAHRPSICWQMCLYRTDLDETKHLAASVLIQF